MTQKPKWDGRSRVATDLYRENFKKIFNVKELPKLKQDIVKSKKYGDIVENIIDRKMHEKKNPR